LPRVAFVLTGTILVQGEDEMPDKLVGERILGAIELGELDLEVVPDSSAGNSMTSDVFEIVVRIGDDEFARVGVWKTASGGPVGNGAPHVQFDGRTVHVSSGDGMNGSFDIDCEFDAEAEEIANILDDRLNGEYDEIEVEIGNSTAFGLVHF
jgi:hypothetical protein